jgi:hypothetical protein
MNKEIKKPFIPRDKPKSWVIGIIAVFTGIAIGLIAGIMSWLNLKPIFYICAFLFVCCWIVGAVNMVVFNFKLFTGKYHGLSAKEWKDQVW